jgi:hypothetical protein
MRLLAAGSAAASLAAVVVLPTARAESRAPMCTSGRGAIVGVDFGHWGGPMVVGCSIAPASGYELLHDAGFSTAGTVHDGPGFVCRLGSRKFHDGAQFPTVHQDPCVVTPPESAYWSYWAAGRRSNTWSYDGLGALSDVPASGGVELWEFGAKGTRPSITPDQLRARRTAPSTAAAATPPAAAGTSGSPAPAIAAGAIVLVLGGGAGWRIWRRRREQP